MAVGAKVMAILWVLARAPEGPVQEPIPIEWQGPETCPKSVFVERVHAYLDQGMPSDATVIRARAHVEDRTRLWYLDLEIERQDGTSRREFSAQTCETVADAGAFVLAVAIEPGVQDRHAAPLTARMGGGLVPEPGPTQEEPEPIEEEPEPIEEEPAEEPPAPEPAPEPTEPPEETEPTLLPDDTATAPPPVAEVSSRRDFPHLGYSLGVLGGVDLFAMPGVGGQIRGLAGVDGRYWRADLWGDYRFPTEKRSDIDLETGGRFSRWAVGARGCGVPLDGLKVQIPLCAGIEAGQVIGRGIGDNLDPRLTSSLPWVAPAAAAGLWWMPLSWLSVGVEVDVAVPLLRHDFGVDGIEDPVHTLGPVAFSPLAGIQARLQ